MELAFEIRNAKHFVSAKFCRKTFKQAGGVIGRGADCDWIIPDSNRYLSNHHAIVSYRDGKFFLTDRSSNGVVDAHTGARLPKDSPVPIEDGSTYLLGEFEIVAQLPSRSVSLDGHANPPEAAGSLIPDDAFLGVDPVMAFDQRDRIYSKNEEVMTAVSTPHPPLQSPDYARIDMENLRVPELIDDTANDQPTPAPERVECQSESFWERFGTSLGLNLTDLCQDQCEALALNAARLLRQSIGGLQQSLQTRSELRSELRLAQTVVQGAQKNPLKFAADASEALEIFLLQPGKSGQLSAEQAVARSFRDLQAHQIALLAGCRAAVRGTLEHFSPERLALRFERDNQPIFSTSGSRWKAFGRYHHSLRQDNDWSERLLARDFAQAYEEQVRLISTFHTDRQG